MANGKRRTVEEIIKDDNAVNKGTIFRRGRRWWVEYYLDSKRIQESLKTEDHQIAIEKRAIIVGPLSAKKEENRLKSIQHRVDDEVKKREEAEERKIAEKKRKESEKGKFKVIDAWNIYIADKSRPQSGPETLKDYGYNWGKFTTWLRDIYPGDVAEMESVTRGMANDFANYLETERLSPNRYNKVIRTCRRVFRVLSEQCNHMTNPFAKIQNKKLETQGHRELSEGELMSVCAKATGELRALFAVGLYTALRLGDCCTLEWEEIKLPLHRIVRKPEKVKGRKKNDTVVIPIHPVLQGILEETSIENRRGYVLPETAKQYLKDRPSVSRVIQNHFTLCKIDTKGKRSGKNVPPEIGFQSLRHSFVTIMASAGTALPVVQELCGHESPAIQQVYLHMGEDATRKAIMSLPDISGNAVVQSDDDIHPNHTAIKMLKEMTEDNWCVIKDKVIAHLQCA